jgi:hypothetical protein
VQGVLLLAGTGSLLAGAALMLAPGWFFEHIGPYPPFNRHYAGDLGAFNVAIGLALLLAVRDPPGRHLLVGIAALGNILHAANHVHDAMVDRVGIERWLRYDLATVMTAIVLAVAYVYIACTAAAPGIAPAQRSGTPARSRGAMPRDP